MKINLTKLRERATKCAESMPGPWHTGHISEFDNTQEVAAANGISIGEIELPEAHSHIVACDPNTVIGLIDEIERLRGALEFYSNHGSTEKGSSTQWHGHTLHTLDKFGCLDENIEPHCYADEALETHKETFE